MGDLPEDESPPVETSDLSQLAVCAVRLGASDPAGAHFRDLAFSDERASDKVFGAGCGDAGLGARLQTHHAAVARQTQRRSNS